MSSFFFMICIYYIFQIYVFEKNVFLFKEEVVMVNSHRRRQRKLDRLTMLTISKSTINLTKVITDQMARRPQVCHQHLQEVQATPPHLQVDVTVSNYTNLF